MSDLFGMGILLGGLAAILGMVIAAFITPADIDEANGEKEGDE